MTCLRTRHAVSAIHDAISGLAPVPALPPVRLQESASLFDGLFRVVAEKTRQKSANYHLVSLAESLRHEMKVGAKWQD